MKSAVLVAMAVALTACGMQPVPVVPLANRQSDAAGKRFWNPMPGMTAVYIYRSADAVPPPVLSLTAGDKPLGWLTPSTWLRADIAPGRYDLRCVVGNELAGSTNLELRPSHYRVTLRGAVVGLRPYGDAPPPVWVAAHRPKGLALAGRLGRMGQQPAGLAARHVDVAVLPHPFAVFLVEIGIG